MYYGNSNSFNGAKIKYNTEKLVEFLRKDHPAHPLVFEFDNSKYRYDNESELALFSVKPEALEDLFALINDGGPLASSNAHKLRQYINLLKSFKTKAPKNLQDLATALRQYIIDSCYTYGLVTLDETPSYYRAIKIEYEKYDPERQIQAQTILTLAYCSMNEHKTTSKTFYTEDLQKSATIEELLKANNLRAMTKEDFEEYQERLALYHQYVTKVGLQVNPTVSIKVYPSREFRRTRDWDFDYNVTINPQTKLVIDTHKIKAGLCTDNIAYFMQHEHENEAQAYPSFDHCMLEVFSLDHKMPFDISVTNIKPYIFNDNILEDIVLPEEHKTCIDILMHAQSADFGDVIRNKSNGVIVLASGTPGTGKTLSAQCWAESLHKPLYIVQTSELGLKAETIEKNLSDIFMRVQRWNGVVCLDECDAYVHRRGLDLQQNAIVGVFLRVLETFSGVLFMTTNRFKDDNGELFVDDAIISRTSAHIVYTLPDLEATKKILAIQLKAMNLETEESDAIAGFLHEHECSGRDIRNFVKLAKMFLIKNNSIKVTVEDIMKVLPFHATISTRS